MVAVDKTGDNSFVNKCGFSLDSSADYMKAVSTDSSQYAFQSGQIWNGQRSPSSDLDDSAGPAIPEFPTMAVPVAGVVILFGLVRRRRRRNVWDMPISS